MTTTTARFVSQDELDAMTDAEFARFEDECANDDHPDGVTCVMCADEADMDFGLDADWADRSGGYLGRMWQRSGFGWGDRAATIEDRAHAIIIGNRMVKAFVNTFTGGGGRYRVTFDPRESTAGINYEARTIVISPAPVLDDTITADEAGVILTAMAVHEASHARYGQDVVASIARAFGRRRDYAHPHADTARGLANILEDVRIERRFAADYPGYAHVFAPAAKYVAEAGMRKAGVTVIRPDADRPLAFAGQAIRYAPWCDWSGIEAERDWWTAWADRWADKGTPRARIAAIREAIDHIPSMENPPVEQPTDSDESDTTSDPGDTDDTDDDADDDGDDMGSGSDDDTDDDGDESDDDGDEPWNTPDYRAAERQNEEDEAANADDDDDAADGDESDADDEGEGEDGEDDGADDAQREANEAAQRLANEFANEAFSACPTEAIAAAAIANGVDSDAIDGAAAERVVDEEEHIVTVDMNPSDDGETYAITVRPASQLPGQRGRITRDAAVSAAVRNAFVRSRTGHTDMERGTKRGRCDNRSLARVANNDYRLFHRRHAPSPGRYLVRMLVDWSASMTYGDDVTKPFQKVSAIAASIADASRHVDSIRVTVEGWTTPSDAVMGVVNAGDRKVIGALHEAWRSGQPVERIGDLQRISMHGTPDAFILRHVITTIAAECRDTGETPVIVMLSDGNGYLRMLTPEAQTAVAMRPGEPWGTWTARRDAVQANPASYYTPEAVTAMMDEARRAGVRVISVAIGEDVNEDAQRDVYGHGNYITWQGSMTATAIPLARMLGRMVAS